MGIPFYERKWKPETIAKLEAEFGENSQPPAQGWITSENSPRKRKPIPKWAKPLIKEIFNQLIERKKREGKQITRYMIGSCWANATNIVINFETGHWKSKLNHWILRRTLYDKLVAKRKLESFKALPITRKVGRTL